MAALMLFCAREQELNYNLKNNINLTRIYWYTRKMFCMSLGRYAKVNYSMGLKKCGRWPRYRGDRLIDVVLT